jgi:hypothetical protein
MKITICVRKRPISQKEVDRFDYDSGNVEILFFVL